MRIRLFIMTRGQVPASNQNLSCLVPYTLLAALSCLVSSRRSSPQYSPRGKTRAILHPPSSMISFEILLCEDMLANHSSADRRDSVQISLHLVVIRGEIRLPPAE